MRTRQEAARRTQLWMLVGYSLSVMAMFGMDRGVWRHVVMGISAVLLAVTVTLVLRARLRGECDGIAAGPAAGS